MDSLSSMISAAVDVHSSSEFVFLIISTISGISPLHKPAPMKECRVVPPMFLPSQRSAVTEKQVDVHSCKPRRSGNSQFPFLFLQWVHNSLLRRHRQPREIPSDFGSIYRPTRSGVRFRIVWVICIVSLIEDLLDGPDQNRFPGSSRTVDQNTFPL